MRRNFRRPANALVAVCLILIMTSSALGGTSWSTNPVPEPASEPENGPHTALREKADPALVDRLEAGPAGLLQVLVAGPKHESMGPLASLGRPEVMGLLETRSQDFFDDVTGLVSHAGGQVHATYPLAPAISLSADSATLSRLAGLDRVVEIALVGPGSLQLTASYPTMSSLGAPEQGRDVDEGPGAENTQGRQMMQTDDAWALGFRGAGVRVASISTGVDVAHEAFRYENGSSRLLAWADCSSGTCDGSGSPFDDHGHGTHTAASAVGSSGYDHPDHGTFEEAGPAPEAQLIAAKFLSSSGGGTWAGAVASIEWAFQNDADITLNAWGAPCMSVNQALYQAIETSTGLGMLSVFGVGGGGPGTGTVGFPACMEATLSVGAVDSTEQARSSSARGPCTDPVSGKTFLCPDAVALGEAVRSAVPRSGTCSFCDPSGYRVISGTSPATGLATGYLGVAEGMKRDVTGSGWDTASAAEREVLNATAKDLGPQGPDNTYGYGLPQLLNVYALLNSTDEAVIVDRFEISDEQVHMGESTLLSFSVRNVGSAEATGDLVVQLVHPDGTVEPLANEEVTLGLLEGREITHTVTATGNVAPGDYTFQTSFDYTWTNGTGEQKTGLIEHEGSFTVNRVFLEMELEGLPNETHPGTVQSLSFAVVSSGNAPARDVTLEFTVPEAYSFLPSSGFDPMDPESFYADPAPDRVIQMSNPQRTVLIWDVGDLAPGGSFSFDTELLPKDLGDHRFMAVAKFSDDGGNTWSQVDVYRQTVSL